MKARGIASREFSSSPGRALAVIARIRAGSVVNGTDTMTMKRINAEVSAVRSARKRR
jgi:hypothetical protein